MKLFSRFVSLTLCGLSVFPLLSGCGNGNNGVLTPLTDAGSGEQTLNFGSLTTRIAGTAQPPVTSAGSGSTVTGIAGATISSMVLTQPTVNLAQTKIVFGSNRDGNYQIYIMNGDGTGQTRLTSGLGGNGNPALSPDGTKIAFYSDRSGNSQIYVMKVDGTEETRLTNTPGKDNRAPSWFPDGSKIVFTSNRDGNYEIYTMNATDGSALARLTTNAAHDYAPQWSPDGSKIAFHSDLSDLNNNNDIYTMTPAGGNVTRLTSTAGNDLYPAWSPDSKEIAFVSRRDGPEEIYIMLADGTAQRRVTSNANSEVSLDFSPDGSKLAYYGSINSVYQISTINRDGTGQAQLTIPPGESSYPNWSKATTKRLTLIGTGGRLGTAAAGFVYGRNGDNITSLLTFDSAAATRANARVTTTTGIAEGLSNYSFTVTHPTALTALGYTNDVYGVPTVVIGTGGLAVASSVLVDYNATTGKVIAIIPFEANRAAEPTQVEGETFRHRGKLLGVWTAEGKNIAPNGAAEVEVNSQTGAVRIVR